MDTTIKKVKSGQSPAGEMGQKYLVSGKNIAMRLWDAEQPAEAEKKNTVERDYETVGYVIEGRAELYLGDQKIVLEPGDSWLVPAGAAHRYHLLEPFTAVEATTPPARIHERDKKAE